MTQGAALRFPGSVAQITPDKPALVMASSGETISYSSLDAQSNRVARALRDLGLQPASHISICMENRIELPQVVWGAHYAGLYYTLFSTRLTAPEAAYIAADSESELLIVSERIAERLGPEFNRRLGDRIKLVQLDQILTAASMHSGAPLSGAVEGSDMLYSSGTTGRPKGVRRAFTNRPLGSTAPIAALAELLVGMNNESVYLSPAPLYHAAPLRWVQEVMCLGATSIVVERFDAEDTLRIIEKYRVSHAQFVPTMLIRMLRLPKHIRDCYDLSSLRAVIHAAAPCPIDIKHQVLDWLGPIVHEYYSGTEGVGLCWCDSAEWLKHPGTVGRPVIGKLHILGTDGEELPTGQDGLVFFEGGNPFEYHNDERKTAEAHSREGWSTMGDIGRLDAEGFLYLTDRASDVVITGGVNVYPQETENVLASHPKVADVAVIGIPNPEFGEELKAVVQPAHGVEPNVELTRELIDHCRSELADLKCPRSIDFVDELPRQPSGKLFKRVIRDPYWADRDTRI